MVAFVRTALREKYHTANYEQFTENDSTTQGLNQSTLHIK